MILTLEQKRTSPKLRPFYLFATTAIVSPTAMLVIPYSRKLCAGYACDTFNLKWRRVDSQIF